MKVGGGMSAPAKINAKIMTELTNYQKPGKPDVIADFIMKWGIWIGGSLFATVLIIGAWLWEL